MSTIISQPRFTCALGAQQTVLSIPRAVPIVHAGPGCSMKIFTCLGGASGHQGEGYAGGNHVPCTNTDESDVVFGGEKGLRSVIDGSLKVMKGDLYVALSGCTAGIIGDDTEAVAREFADQGYPVVGIDTPGFKGNNYIGHEVVVRGIIDQFVGEVKPNIQKGLVNVFSVVPFQDPFWRGDLEQIKYLLESIGLHVNILFGVESKGIEEWKNIPNAQFNLLISPWVGQSTVEYLNKKYKTPYLHYPILPVGAKGTSKFLRAVAEYAGIEKSIVEKVIDTEEKRYYDYFIAIADFLSVYQNNLPYELHISADSAYTISIAKYLEEELGYIPKSVFAVDDPDEKTSKLVRNIFEEQLPEYKGLLKFEADSELIVNSIKPKLENSTRALVLGSDWERFLTKETGNVFLYISSPINQKLLIQKTYLGYRGGLNLVEDIYNALYEGREISGSTYANSLGGDH